MTFARRLARPMLAAIFIDGGIQALRDPGPRVALAEPVASTVAQATALPDDAELLVKVNASVQIGAGALLAVGRAPRLASLALIGSIVPTTFAGHRFWEEQEPAKRKQQRIHFLKNVGLLGGLILAAVDTDGAPSTAWRAKRAVRRIGHKADTGLIGASMADAGRIGASVAGAALSAASQAGELGRRKAVPAVKGVATRLAEEAPRVLELASKVADEAQPVIRETAGRALDIAGQVSQRVREFEHA